MLRPWRIGDSRHLGQDLAGLTRNISLSSTEVSRSSTVEDANAHCKHTNPIWSTVNTARHLSPEAQYGR